MRTLGIARRLRRLATAMGVAACVVAGAGSAAAVELLTDPGFENTSPLGTDPWRLVFFTTAPVSTNATVMPASGLEHASVTKNHALPNADPQIGSSAFAGFGAAASISDFRGMPLDLSVNYKVNENTITSGGTPGTFVRMFMAFYGTGGFLGFGSFANADVFVESTNDSYQTLAFSDVVPSFGSPVTSMELNLSVLGQAGGTGSATVFFDNASLSIVPEPASAALASVGLAWLVNLKRRARRQLG